MSKSYFKRVITYDEKTANFKIECPELGLSVLSDTEMGGLLEMRKEVEAAAKKQLCDGVPLTPPPMNYEEIRWPPPFTYEQVGNIRIPSPPNFGVDDSIPRPKYRKTK